VTKDALVIEVSGPLGTAQRDEVTAEGERMPRVVHPESSYGIRSGTVRT
jgi:hypothetical protein